jgi:hypothetical protein
VSAAASCAVIDAVPNRACDDVEIRDLNGDIDAAFVQASSFSFRCKPGFDKGYISFSDEGVILGSARLSEAIQASLGLPAVPLRKLKRDIRPSIGVRCSCHRRRDGCRIQAA